MTPTQEGSIRLFRAAGVNVFIHWSWFLVAFWMIDNRAGAYSSPVWNVIEYLGLFLIVLMHEYGHSLATRQVGGHSDTIVLWPFGGVAYVRVPERPGATLWGIAAGPLVNVVLVVVLALIDAFAGAYLSSVNRDAGRLLAVMQFINLWLLIFNMLPIYPLDGGQMLRALLWFPLGRVKSLKIATILGFVGVAGLGIYAFQERSIWMGVMTAFIFMNCRQGWQHARALSQLEAMPTHKEFACPECKASPPAGEFWKCRSCENGYDPFTHGGSCRHCGTQYSIALCPACGAGSRLSDWRKAPTIIVEGHPRA